MTIKCVVACVAADGTPALFPCVVACTQAEYDEGEHYEAAQAAARDEGYEQTNRAVVFDENDGPEWLFVQLFSDDPA